MQDSECKQSQVNILKLLALVGDVLLDHFPVSSLTHGRGVVRVRPEFASPQFCAYVGVCDPKVSPSGLADLRIYSLTYVPSRSVCC